MQEQLDSDQINRLWEHGMHEDNRFNNQLTFFLVFESIFLGVVGVLSNRPTIEKFVLIPIVLLGLILTILLAYVQARQKYIYNGLEARLREVVPEFQITLMKREEVKWPISSLWLLTYAIPGAVTLVWITLLIFAFIS